MGEIQGNGYDAQTGRVWCVLFAIADNNHTGDEARYTLNMPEGNFYETHTVTVDSINRNAGYDANYANGQLNCLVRADYNGGTFGGPRSWIRATFVLDTRGFEDDFLGRIDPNRLEFLSNFGGIE